MNDAYFAEMRQQMLADITAHTSFASEHIGKDSLAPRVMAVMGKVPRHEFVPVELQVYAYGDTPLPIGYDKTISQPFIVALMTDLLGVNAGDVVLEVGTGLGYQAAILAELAHRVYTMDVVEELSERARRRLRRLGYTNVETRIADGYHGWPEAAPFDRIIVTAAPDLIPPPLINQLKCGGKLVIPAGLPESQKLMVLEKDPQGKISTTEGLPVRFGQLESSQGARVC